MTNKLKKHMRLICTSFQRYYSLQRKEFTQHLTHTYWWLYSTCVVYSCKLN